MREPDGVDGLADRTTHGTGIRTAAPETLPKPPPQLIGIYGSPMECLDIYIHSGG